MAARLIARMGRQMQKIIDEDNPYFTAIYDESNFFEWYFIVANLDVPYIDGEYIFKLTAKYDFPHSPPTFEALTPNGMFEIGGPICMSMGEYHARDYSSAQYGWRPVLGMSGFIKEVISLMVGCDNDIKGIRINNQSPEQKMALARKSAEYNVLHNSHLIFDQKYFYLKITLNMFYLSFE